jgi:predicted nucleic acid-binding protein
MQNQGYRVVLDANEVIGAGSKWLERGVPSPDKNTHRRVLLRVAESHIGLYSDKIVGEYLEKLVALNHPKDRALKMMIYIMGAFLEVKVTTENAPVPPADPDDEVFLLCAIDGNADYLVSEDQHLTDIKSSYAKPVIGRSDELAGALGA